METNIYKKNNNYYYIDKKNNEIPCFLPSVTEILTKNYDRVVDKKLRKNDRG